ncbi:MAG: glycosyltransferase, partial [Planctomycetes bacterium]|nr:glycosyltransferase [Planctomycetota bacterium]
MARHAFGNTAAWVAATLTPFVVTALVFRRLGEGAYGVWATVLALRGVLLLLDGGLVLGVSRDAALLADEGRGRWARIRGAWRVHVAIAVLALGLGAVGAGMPGALLGVTGEGVGIARAITLLAAIEAAVATMGSPLLGILRGRERFDAVAVAAASQGALAIGLVLLLIGPFGLIGAAAAMLGARIAVQLGLLSWMRSRRLLDRPDGPGDARPQLGTVVGFALPIWVSAIGAWLGMMADVPLVGAVFGEEPAGHAALGANFAAAAASLLFAILGAAFPRFVAARPGERGESMAAVLFLGTTLAAAGFGLCIVCAGPILTLWVGTAPTLATEVLVLYALMWAVNTPTHVLSSMAIAASRHRILLLTTAVAVPVNVGASLALALAGLPQGPAIASLAVVVLSNWLLFPLLALRRLDLGWTEWARPAAAGYLVGAVVATLVAIVLRGLAAGPQLTLALGIGLTLLLAGVVLDLTVRKRSSLKLLMRRLRRGGFAVRRRQRRQCREVRTRLAAAPRRTTPLAERPLVTVRIATYNRGRLVAERALASAIAQTYDNLEIVVVGDCCDAATAAAVRSVDDPRIRFVNLPERGRYPSDPLLRWMVAGSTPMNHGVELARGEWIAPLDDDDEFAPDHVEVMLRECIERDLDFAWGIAESELANGEWQQQGAWPLRHGQICHSAVFYHRRIAEIRHDLDAWRLDEPGDWNLWSRIRDAGARLGFVDRVVTRHYVERRDVVDRRPWWMARRRSGAVGAVAAVAA